ncbi:T9SS C-terminal target domain-containing protein, partial [Dyadobacter sp. CY323]|nr:T9SS C-terminal target domain-containing protein [Dyadobacter sp. CY323]
MKKYYRIAIAACIFLSVAITSFAQGIVYGVRSGSKGIVSFSASSKLTGIGNAKHVDGYVEKNGSGSFVFPVGHKGMYRPFAAESDGILGAYFRENPTTASLPSGGPFTTTNKEGTLKKVGTTEFWDIDGTNASRITLTWNANSNVGILTGNSLSFLTIVGWNKSASRWEKIVSVVDELSLLGGNSTTSSGSITTTQNIVPNTYSIYTLAASTAASAPVDYQGALEAVSCTEIRGWVWDKNYPDATLTVELVEGNTVHATATGKEFRQDLKINGIGTGNYGFVISTPASLMDGKIHQLSIRVKGSSVILSGSPQSLNCSYGGDFEGADCYTLKGWVWDKNSPNTPLTVELREGNIIHAITVANVYRADLKDSGIGTGKYGFNIPAPATLKDGKSHQLTIKTKDVNYRVEPSRTVNCPLNDYFGRFALDCDYVQGWAWDKNYPNNAVTVEVYEGNIVHATFVANAYLEDLKNNGTGTGNYGFKIPTPLSLKDGKSHQLNIRVKGNNTALSAPQTVTCAVNQYAGRFGGVDCNYIQGWAWDKNAPDAAMTVEVFEGSTVYATAVADIYREDVKNSGIGTGNYGFKIATPLSLKDGKAHHLNVRIKGTSTILLDSPKSVTCVANQYAGRFNGADCSFILGWAWDKNFPDTAVTVEVYEGNMVYATAVANIYREDVKVSGIGTGNYGFKIATPASLRDGKAHSLSVRVKGSTTVLLDSPKIITCAANEYAGRLKGADCDYIQGWAWDKNAPDGAVTVEVYEG